MPTDSNYQRKYRLLVDHCSFRGTVYSRAGDVVALVDNTTYIIQAPGPDCGGYVVIYQDAAGERFSCAASLLQEVPATRPLKKKYSNKLNQPGDTGT